MSLSHREHPCGAEIWGRGEEKGLAQYFPNSPMGHVPSGPPRGSRWVTSRNLPALLLQGPLIQLLPPSWELCLEHAPLLYLRAFAMLSSTWRASSPALFSRASSLTYPARAQAQPNALVPSPCRTGHLCRTPGGCRGLRLEEWKSTLPLGDIPSAELVVGRGEVSCGKGQGPEGALECVPEIPPIIEVEEAGGGCPEPGTWTRKSGCVTFGK